jgi:hypothetical protein
MLSGPSSKSKQSTGNQMAKRGGKRPGAGRRKGSVARATREQKGTLGELARRYTDVAMATLASVAKKGESESAKVAASIAILDRGYGKPAQAVEHRGSIGTYDLSKLSDDQIDRLEEILGPLADAGGDQGGEGEEGD